MSNYFEPNANLRERTNSKSKTKRKIIVRIATREDAKLFTEKTGIGLIEGKVNRVTLPITNTLDGFFD